MCGRRRGFLGHCGCDGHQPRLEGFVIPCLLLLLKEKPAHGYELVERLDSLPFLERVPDPGVVYRHLRRLKDESMIESRLEPGSGGPARTVYSLTPEGEGYLRAWAAQIAKRKESMEGFLAEFRRHFPQQGDKGHRG